MVEKKEGATMTCKNCDTDLICRLKEYGGDFKPTLQWQNFDGSAHYSTKDGKTFSCNIPDEDEISQTRISSNMEASNSENIQIPILNEINRKLDTTISDLQRIKEFVEPLFLKMVDEQIGRKDH